MGFSLPPSSVAVLTTTAVAHEHSYNQLCSPDDDDYYEDDGFEFTPLLLKPRPRRRINARTERPRTVVVHVVAATRSVVAQPPHPPQQRARRRAPSVAAVPAPARKQQQQQQVRWHDMAFGSVRVPAAMDMGEIRRRLRARQPQAALAGGNGAGTGNEQPSSSSAAGWAPWRLIRSLSCKGVEAVAAAAAPVRLV